MGLRSSLSRLGGGIGTRGPGEKKLEIDRRLIRDRISVLKREVEDMKQQRELARKNREKNPVTVVAIVGYTNAGKSTFLNKLTSAGVLEEDKLFATLDPTTRNYKLESGQEILLTDTVGFIRKLPHHLIDAFRSTLEEAKYSDIIIHMVDSSNPQMEAHMKTVYETLDNLGVGDKPVITVFNKQDKLEDEGAIFRDSRADYLVNASIKQGKGIDKILSSLRLNKVLKSLSIGDNKNKNNKAFFNLPSYLKFNNSLISLDIKSSKIDSKILLHLGKSLKDNKKLIYLNLIDNNLDYQTIIKCGLLIRKNNIINDIKMLLNKPSKDEIICIKRCNPHLIF